MFPIAMQSTNRRCALEQRPFPHRLIRSTGTAAAASPMRGETCGIWPLRYRVEHIKSEREPNSPPQTRRGGAKRRGGVDQKIEFGWAATSRRHQEKTRSHFEWSGRGDFLTNTTPSALTSVASRLYPGRASTPPRLRRGVRSLGL